MKVLNIVKLNKGKFLLTTKERAARFEKQGDGQIISLKELYKQTQMQNSNVSGK